MRKTIIRMLAAGCAALTTGLAPPASAYRFTITPGLKSIYLQVGNGTYNGGNYNAGGQPANNPQINVVTVTVPAAAIGNGTVLPMISNSTTANSFIEGYALCTPPAQVYVGGWSRPGILGSSGATLSVSSPTSLTSGTSTIPFSQIKWTSSANDGTGGDMAGGTFNGGTVPLATLAANQWVESCLTFTYSNGVVPDAGTYTGRTIFTLSQP